MNTNTGQLYASYDEAVADLKPTETRSDVVEIHGSYESAMRVSAAVKAKRRAENKRARRARRSQR